jgi:hypothetical protein
MMDLLPVGKRPRCWCCNKELRPRYRTVKEGSHVETKFAKQTNPELSAEDDVFFRPYEPDEYFDRRPVIPGVPLNANLRFFEKDDGFDVDRSGDRFRRLSGLAPNWKAPKTGWFWCYTRDSVDRTFLGDYGGYGDNKFCGINCGYAWAVRYLGDQVRMPK